MPGGLPCGCYTVQVMSNERVLINLLKKLMDSGAGQPPASQIGLSPTQINIIDLIHIEGRISVQKLSKSLHLSPPTVSVAVKKMETEGFILKDPDKNDARIINIQLTNKALLLYNEIEQYRLDKVEKLLSNLDSPEQTQFLQLLNKALL